MLLALPVSTNNLTSSIGFSLSWDLLILIGILAAVFLYGIMAGKNRLIGLILATYFSWAIVGSIPWNVVVDLFSAKNLPSPAAEAFLFFAVALAIVFLLPRSALGHALRISKSGKGGSWLQVVLFGVLEAGLLGVVILSFLPAKSIMALNPLIGQIFYGETAKFIWFLAPILVLLFWGRGRGEA